MYNKDELTETARSAIIDLSLLGRIGPKLAKRAVLGLLEKGIILVKTDDEHAAHVYSMLKEDNKNSK